MPFVYRIDDSTREYTMEDLDGNSVTTGLRRGGTVADLKNGVATTTGVPAARQRYCGVSEHTDDGFRFDTDEILRIDDDRSVVAALRDLAWGDHIKSTVHIGVVFLPAEADAHGNGDEDEDEDDYVEVAPEEADAIAVVAAAAAEFAEGDSGSEEKDDEEEDNTDEDDEEDDSTEVEANGVGDNGGNGVDADADAIEADGGDASPDAAPDEEDEDAQGEGVANAGDNNNAAAVVAPADNEDPTASSLRLWLRGLEVNGVAAGRFERYTPAFEHHFASLADLALVCEEEDMDTMWEALFKACRVSRLGDRLRLKRAVQNLPRQPE